MLDALRKIVQEVNEARDLDHALRILVARVKHTVSVDVCSVYLTDFEREQHVLMATDGLNPAAVGEVKLASGEGLTGLVAARAEPLNLEDAPEHPRFKYIPETGEAPFHAYLGVPIIHQRKVLGVLVVQQRARRRFSDDDVALVVTLAAQLAGVIAHAQVSGGLNALGAVSVDAHSLQGLPGAPGVGTGRGVVVYPPADLDAVPDCPIEESEPEVEAFRVAVQAVQENFRSLGARMGGVLPVEDQALFDAFVMMAGSEGLVEGTIERIRAGNWAQGALRETIREHARIFADMDDAYLRERAADIRDLGRRILERLQADAHCPREYPPHTVLVGEEISAAQLAEVPSGRLEGLVSAHGSGSSHVAILARAMGVPAVMGVSDLPVGRMEARELLVDGYQGRVHIQPSVALREEFTRLAGEEAELREDLKGLRDLAAETPDGVHVPLLVNTGLLADITPSLTSGAEGIGLYRTEIPFMIRDRFPGEEEQYRIYRQVLEQFAPRPVHLRTLDVGGDKMLAYFPVSEANPFLGWRGIRLTLDHPEIFLTQLRAMLRANEGLGNLSLLLPMVSGVRELDEALVLVRQATEELAEEGSGLTAPRVGVMIEVPSAVYQTDAIAKRVDFLSVGTNDLTQYLLAVDRNNERVAKLYQVLHPAVINALIQVVHGAHAHGRPVSVCGEMAGDPAAAILLLGMGMDSLSMSVSSLPQVKWVIRSLPQRRARELLGQALLLEDPAAVRKLLTDALEEIGLGGLVRPGR
ncbi:MAG: phosphoenolpyruvate--protein phosphotransferase [Gammaproteobacteria bacterium]|nr:phosphoenolpyruvate--protein phosphotransferase [Gammaproteobacteria bacterium]